jgi:hypothetical protein
MFWIVRVNLGVDPTRYVEESVVAVTPMLASGQRPVGSATGTTGAALVVDAGAAVATALALVETAGVG